LYSIPNPNREATLRELLESDAYQRSASAHSRSARRSTVSRMSPICTDAASAHRRTTGTGKSVGLNSMLTSLLPGNA
jgi:DNA segregation ATPase FtsK/SpoIIIE-like protein